MLTSWNLYWITRFDDIKCIFLSMLITSIAVLCSVGFMSFVFQEDQFEQLKLNKSIFMVSLLFSGICYPFIPTTKEMAFIYVVPKLANTQIAKDIGDEFIQIEKLAAEYVKGKLKAE